MLLGVGILALVTYYFSNQVLRIRTHPNETILAFEIDQGRISKGQLEQFKKEQISIDSPYGYSLNAWFIPAVESGSSRAVVFVHGVTSSLLGMLKYADMFRRRGYHVVLYDHRRHGLSGGAYTTYGYCERHDLKTVVDWVYRRLGANAQVGIFGESMGAATSLLYAAMDNRPAFVVADCPYSDLTEQLAHQLKVRYRLPDFPLLMITSLWCKLRAGFYFHEVSPIKQIDRIKAPILFVHGQKDTFVPNRMSESMHERHKGAKALYMAPNAAHAEAWAKNREEYERVLDSFLRSHHLLPEPIHAM